MRDADNAAFQKALRDFIKDAVHYDGYSFQAGWQAALAYVREGTEQKPVAVTECRVNGMSQWGRFDKPEGWLEFRSTGGACVVLAPGSALHDVTISAGGLLTGDKDRPDDPPKQEVPEGYWLAPLVLTPTLRAAGAEGSGEDSEAVAEGAYEAIRGAALGTFSPAAGGYVERMAAVTESSGCVFRDLNVSPPEKE